MKVFINCPKCGNNTLAEVIFYDYEVSHHYDRLLKCLSCEKPVNEHIDLTLNKKEVSDGNANHVLSGQLNCFSRRRPKA